MTYYDYLILSSMIMNSKRKHQIAYFTGDKELLNFKTTFKITSSLPPIVKLFSSSTPSPRLNLHKIFPL